MNICRTGRPGRSWIAVAAASACLMLASGDDTSVAGIQGSGRVKTNAIGPITRFGSVFVNGVEYDTTAANIKIDGAPTAESGLRVGQVVSVKGELNDDGTTGIATEVSFTSDVLGPVAQVDLAGGTLVVLGQRIHVLSDTLLDQTLHLGGLLSLVPGVRVRVSGFPNAAGEIQASRLDLVIGISSSARLRGVVQALNTGAQSFRVGSQVVSYSGVVPTGTLANGSIVQIAGNIVGGQASLQATSVALVTGVGGAEGETGDVQGLITALSGGSGFMLGAQSVVTNASTNFVLHGKTLGPNLAVEVHGYFNATGALVAGDVEALAGGGLGALGIVESISAADHSLTVLGVTFSTSSATAFDDDSGQSARPFGLSEIHVGDYVEIRGNASTAGGPIQATVVNRSDARDDAYLEGVALNLLSPGLRVLGVPVLTTSQTHFPTAGLLGSLKFFLQAANKRVRVQGTLNGHTLVAEQIEFVN